ncbi:MAG: ATP-binding protein [Spirochaetaceae bacterium]
MAGSRDSLDMEGHSEGHIEREAGTPGFTGTSPLQRKLLYAISLFLMAINTGLIVIWAATGAGIFRIALLFCLIVSGGTALQATRRGKLGFAKWALFLPGVLVFLVAPYLHIDSYYFSIVLVGSSLNLILLAGALFSLKLSIFTASLFALNTVVIFIGQSAVETDGRMAYLPIILAQIIIHGAIVYFYIMSRNDLIKKLREENRKHRKTAEVLDKRETDFKLLIENSPIAIFMVDDSGNYLYANEKAAELAGYPRQELLSKNIKELLPAKREDRGAENFEKLRAEGKLETSDTLLSKNGEVKEVDIEAIAVKDNNYMAFVRDVSDRRLHERELNEAMQRAEEANKVKTEFLHTINHEVRTPLNAIIGINQLNADTEDKIERQRHAQSIELAAYSLLEVFDEIIDFAGLERNAYETHISDFNVYSLCEEAMRTFVLKAQEKNLELAFYGAPHLPPVMEGDGGHIKQVLSHLLSNAVKFTESGEVLLSVSGEPEENAEAGDTEQRFMLTFSVKDTGIGIAEELQTRIFELFRQAEDVDTRRYGGVGLGLTICKKVSEVLGGSLCVESREGEGSTFTFQVPVSAGGADPCMPIIRGDPQGKGEKLGVLVCLEPSFERKQAKDVLEYCGHSCRVADDRGYADLLGEKGFEIEVDGESREADVCLIELSALLAEGEEGPLAHPLRRNRKRSTGIIVLVPLFQEGLFFENKELYGIDRYITFPLTPSKLLQALSNVSSREYNRSF